MHVQSREYKVMLAHDRFVERLSAIEQFWSKLGELAQANDTVTTSEALTKCMQRTIVFLDTPELAIRQNDLILRRRADTTDVAYTIKCRSDDRYITLGTKLKARKVGTIDKKLEEDIAAPFRCRLSRSTSVTLPANGTSKLAEPPRSLGEAARLFPRLSSLHMHGHDCPLDTHLRTVRDIVAYERVYTGGKLRFQDLGAQRNDVGATVAVIVWTDGKDGPPLVAEFSFRIEDADERFSPELATAARSFYERVQCMDWCLPNGITKTEYIYGDRAGD